MGCYPNIISSSPKSLEDGQLVERKEEEEEEEEVESSRMVWGLSLILSLMRRKGWRIRKRMKGVADKGEMGGGLLSEDGEGERGVSSSDELLLSLVHSSFRFSFRSQAEAEEGGLAKQGSGVEPTVLLLMNLEDDDGEERERGREKWRRLDSLEESISPVVGMLVRFSYEQIKAATRDFARGKFSLINHWIGKKMRGEEEEEEEEEEEGVAVDGDGDDNEEEEGLRVFRVFLISG